MIILSWLYAIVTGIRNGMYSFSILKSKRVVGVEVICIGNITVGGTGKTPMVQYFAKKYLDEGRKVAIVSRGYKGKRSIDPMVVSDYTSIKAKIDESGDEPFLHASCLAGIPVIVAKKRYEGVELAKKTFNSDLVILDDGFQHRQLFRDKNIVLIDATDPFGGGKLLPQGRLREPLNGLKRANEIIITKSNLVGRAEIEKIVSVLQKFSKPLLYSSFSSLLLVEDKEVDLKKILGLHVMVISAIAKPENIYKTVSSFRPNFIEERPFPDHHHYTPADIEQFYRLKEQKVIDFFVTTQKDWVKLSQLLSARHKKDWVVIKQNYILGEKLDAII